MSEGKVCPVCGSDNVQTGIGYDYCLNCGNSVKLEKAAAVPAQEAPAVQPQAPVQPQVPVQPQYNPPYAPAYNQIIPEEQIPYQYRPLGAWAYFGYGILFAIPFIGLIFLIVFSFSKENINRRNYARSYFCWLAISLIFLIIAGALGAFTMIGDYI